MAIKSSEAKARDEAQAKQTTADFIQRMKSGATKAQATEAEPELDKVIPFPRDLCEPPGVLGDFSRYVTDTARCERPQLSLAVGIALFGTAFGKWYRSEERDGNRTNFYCMAVVDSSGGKGHPQETAINLLCRAGDDALELVESEVTCDTAIEQALKEGWNVKLFFIDECGEFLKSASAANANAAAGQANILECLKKLYSKANSTYASKRKVDKPRIFIREPQANFFGATTPSRFADGMSPEEIEGGWTGRCLVFTDNRLVRGKDKPLTPYPPKLIEVLQRFAPRKGTEPPQAQVVHFTDEAKAVYADFDSKVFAIRERLEAVRDPYRPIFGKTVENAKKLGLLFACSRSAYDDHPQPIIDADAANWACKLSYICSHNLFVFASEHAGGTPFGKLKSKVYREIKAAKTEGLTPRDISRAVFDMGTKEREAIITSLIEAGLVAEKETEKSGKAGRPAGARLVATCWLDEVAI